MFCADDAFVSYLKFRKGDSVYLKPYPGNSGDALIYMGGEMLLKEIGLVQVLDPEKADLILWPGGNPAMWSDHLDAWRACWRLWPNKDFVIAPATFQGKAFDWAGMLKNASRNVKAVFARDPESHRNLINADLQPNIKIGLGHDPAFHLKGSEWLSKHREATASDYVLASFRSDHESSMANGFAVKWLEHRSPVLLKRGIGRLRRGFGLKSRLRLVRAQIGPTETIDVLDAPLRSFEAFVELVRRASQVHTDRLHVMILAALLGKKVFGYPTAYGKLECVYEHSIKSWASVQFLNER